MILDRAAKLLLGGWIALSTVSCEDMIPTDISTENGLVSLFQDDILEKGPYHITQKIRAMRSQEQVVKFSKVDKTKALSLHFPGHPVSTDTEVTIRVKDGTSLSLPVDPLIGAHTAIVFEISFDNESNLAKEFELRLLPASMKDSPFVGAYLSHTKDEGYSEIEDFSGSLATKSSLTLALVFVDDKEQSHPQDTVSVGKSSEPFIDKPTVETEKKASTPVGPEQPDNPATPSGEVEISLTILEPNYSLAKNTFSLAEETTQILSYDWTIEAPATANPVLANPTNSSVDFTTDLDGEYKLIYQGTQGDGQGFKAEKAFTWNTQTPDATITNPGFILQESFSITLAPSSSGIVAQEWDVTFSPNSLSLDNPESLTPLVTNTAEGNYTIGLKVFNSLGESAVTTYSYYYDQEAPDAIFEGLHRISSGPLIITSRNNSPDIVSYEWKKESGPGSISFSDPYEANVSVTTPTDGLYQLSVKMTDAAGRTATKTYDFLRDTTNPIVSLNSHIGAYSETFQLNCEDIVVFDLTAVSYSWASLSGPVEFENPHVRCPRILGTDSIKTYTLQLTVADEFGHTAAAQTTFDWTSSINWIGFIETESMSYSSGLFVNQGIMYSTSPTLKSLNLKGEYEENEHVYDGTQFIAGIALDSLGISEQQGIFSTVVNLESPYRLGAIEIHTDINPLHPYLKPIPRNGQGDPSGGGVDDLPTMDGLVFLFGFDKYHHEESDTDNKVIFDGSGNLTNAGAQMFGICDDAKCPTITNDARVGNAFSFDGSQYIEIQDNAANRISSDMSFVTWYKHEVTGGNQYILEKGREDKCDNYAFFVWNNRFQMELTKGDTTNCDGTYENMVSSTILQSGEWYHLAAVYKKSNDEVNFYINGELNAVNNFAQASITPSYEKVFIGKQNMAGANNFLKGKLDELAVFDRELSAAEIQKIYSRGKRRAEVRIGICDDMACSNDPKLSGPFFHRYDANGGHINPLSTTGFKSPSQYYKLEVKIENPPHTTSPTLQTIDLNTHTGGLEVLETTSPVFTYSALHDFREHTTDGHTGQMRYQISNDGATWFYFNGLNWIPAAGLTDNNPAPEISNHINTFHIDAGPGNFYLRGIVDNTSGYNNIGLSNISVYSSP